LNQVEKVGLAMSEFVVGDIVVLTAGSMRMAVEAVDGDQIACLWCHEGLIGRDSFSKVLLKKWEHREEDRNSRPRPYGGDRDRDSNRGDRDSAPKRFDDKPKGKPGWDGKPREKKFFRKD
jgi:hypothetical protein